MTNEVKRQSPAEGFFVVLKPFEPDLAPANDIVIPALMFQAGAGWAF